MVGGCGRLWEVVGSCERWWEVVGSCGRLRIRWEVVKQFSKQWKSIKDREIRREVVKVVERY